MQGATGRENHSHLLRIYVSVSETLGFSYREEIIDTCVPLRKASQEAHSRFNNNPHSPLKWQAEPLISLSPLLIHESLSCEPAEVPFIICHLEYLIK